ncbi:MAG: hypothetical protein Q9187_005476 [Circinaria calcarea]
MPPNYTLYLVTDSTKAILGEKDLVWVVEQAIKGGVTIVQYRDKVNETSILIRVAKDLHRVCKNYGVPLLINDRVDVALAVGAEGVHIGQDDMDLKTARELLGHDAVIGVTCSSVEEACAAAMGGASYLGIGTVFTTPTKENVKSIIGTAGTREILDTLSIDDLKTPTVAIGGINGSNIQRVVYQTKVGSKSLDGIAVVSAIIAADDPRSAASQLRDMIGQPRPSIVETASKANEVEQLLAGVPKVIQQLKRAAPICHNMTNLVVQNFAANVALCIGASPIMANNGEEAKDLAKLAGGLVVNMGTVTPEGLSNSLRAIKAYNTYGGPVLLDPVGAGATQVRRDAVKTLMSGGYFDVIKGNESEINVILGEGNVQQKGVDSAGSKASDRDRASRAKKLAAREQSIVIMTGPVDFISDGTRTYAIKNGHEYLGKVSGTGCTLGTTVAAFIAVEKEDKLLAALSGLLMYEIAAEHAGCQPGVSGPGTFVPAFLDALDNLATRTENGDSDWLVSAAKVEKLDVEI